MRAKLQTSSFLLTVPLALAVGLFAACTDGDGTVIDQPRDTAVKCCACVCADADGDQCARFDSTTSLTDSCDQVCGAQCTATLGCESGEAGLECSVNPDGKNDDPCDRTCKIASSCGLTLYADDEGCRDQCEQNPLSQGVVDCLDASACHPELVSLCLDDDLMTAENEL